MICMFLMSRVQFRILTSSGICCLKRTIVTSRFVKLLNGKISDFDLTGLPLSLQHDFSKKNYEGLIFRENGFVFISLAATMKY